MSDLDTPAREAATGTGERSRPHAVLPALCVTQIVSWGILYYAFPVLNPQITAATGWPVQATTAAFSLALAVSALAGIRVGRILDRRGPRAVMTIGSTLGVISLTTVSAAPDLAAFTMRLDARRTRDGRHLLPARVRRSDPLVGPRPCARTDGRHPRRMDWPPPSSRP